MLVFYLETLFLRLTDFAGFVPSAFSLHNYCGALHALQSFHSFQSRQGKVFGSVELVIVKTQ